MARIFPLLVDLFTLGPLVGFLLLRSIEVFDVILAKTRTGLVCSVAFAALLAALYRTSRGSMSRVFVVGLTFALAKYRVDDLSFAYNGGVGRDLAGQTVLITGASSGIGLALAQELQGPGFNATVVMACRSLKKCEAVKPDGARCMRLDLADLSSVEAFAADFTASYSSLDALINNAGLVAGPDTKTKQGYELNLGVMHLGHFALTRLLLPLLTAPRRAASEGGGGGGGEPAGPAARIVNHASAAFHGGTIDWLRGDANHDLKGEITNGCAKDFFALGPNDLLTGTKGSGFCPLTGSYSRAKLAQVMFTQELQARLDGHREKEASSAVRPVIVSTLHPGIVRSGIVQMSDYLARPTVGGAWMLLQCMLQKDLPGGSYVDEMGNPHDLTETSPMNTATSWFSSAIQAYQQRTEGEPETWRAKLWKVSEREIEKHLPNLPRPPPEWA